MRSLVSVCIVNSFRHLQHLLERVPVALVRELELYEQAGIPAPKVLQMATLGAARIMKRDQELGTIGAGKLADVIVVDGDPVSRIADVRKVRTVIKDGVVYQGSDLCRTVGVR